jgi:hypothetical protein
MYGTVNNGEFNRELPEFEMDEENSYTVSQNNHEEQKQDAFNGGSLGLQNSRMIPLLDE